MSLLEVSGVSMNFGGLAALKQVGFALADGEIVGLIGPNGAGKTTVFNLATGLLKPTTGRISFLGRDITGMAPHRITRLGIARTFQNIRIFPEMTLLENVLVGRHHLLGYGAIGTLLATPAFREAERGARERCLELLSWVRLDPKAGLTADQLSYGEQRKLEFARALATEPKLLLLDEPVAGMNPAEKATLMEEIRNIRERGYGVFLIEHDMRFVMGLCDRIAVLNFGQVIAEGAPDEVRRHPGVIEAYLGRDDEERVS
jgi:branched-chain amino acid transport system ATP-binding protein